MRVFRPLLVGTLLAGFVPALSFAGQTPTPTPTPTPPTRHRTRTAGTTTTSPSVKAVTSVHGVIKGAPTGSTFVVARRGGTVTVDASGATIKARDQAATMAVIKGGTIVTAHGAMQGSIFKATDVIAYPRKPKGSGTSTTATPGTRH
jgi:hypothetical protein